jgi:hypothetical protein
MYCTWPKPRHPSTGLQASPVQVLTPSPLSSTCCSQVPQQSRQKDRAFCCQQHSTASFWQQCTCCPAAVLRCSSPVLVQCSCLLQSGSICIHMVPLRILLAGASTYTRPTNDARLPDANKVHRTTNDRTYNVHAGAISKACQHTKAAALLSFCSTSTQHNPFQSCNTVQPLYDNGAAAAGCWGAGPAAAIL